MTQEQNNIERLKDVYAKVKANSDNDELNFETSEDELAYREQEYIDSEE